jgi:CRP-like cAMP-binding protein
MFQAAKAISEDYAIRKSKLTPLAQFPRSDRRVLGIGDYLYKNGEPRTCVYKLERGAIAVIDQRVDRPVAVRGKGDYVGLGCLERHFNSAKAIVDSIVSFVATADIVLLAERDPILRQEHADAVEQEFECRKELLIKRARATVVERVAAFLFSVSRQNEYEGRDPTRISDTLQGGAVTSLLGLDISTFERALLELHGMNIVEQCPRRGVHLKDLEALKRLADGQFNNSKILDA